MGPANTFLLIGLILSLGILAWVSIRYITLRRQLRDYQKILRNVTAGSTSLLGLPANVKGLESISNGFKALVTSLGEKLSGLEANRARLAAVLDQMTAEVRGRLAAGFRILRPPFSLGLWKRMIHRRA